MDLSKAMSFSSLTCSPPGSMSSAAEPSAPPWRRISPGSASPRSPSTISTRWRPTTSPTRCSGRPTSASLRWMPWPSSSTPSIPTSAVASSWSARAGPARRLSGYVFLCVDNIDLRREIAQACQAAPMSRGCSISGCVSPTPSITPPTGRTKSPWRTSSRPWPSPTRRPPRRPRFPPCNITLSVVPTVRMVVGLGVANFINFVKGGSPEKAHSGGRLRPHGGRLLTARRGGSPPA